MQWIPIIPARKSGREFHYVGLISLNFCSNQQKDAVNNDVTYYGGSREAVSIVALNYYTEKNS